MSRTCSRRYRVSAGWIVASVDDDNSSGVEDPAHWKRQEPEQAPPVVADPRLEAGLHLAFRLLWIAAGSIGVLILYLAVMDYRTTEKVESVVQQAALAIGAPPAGADLALLLEGVARALATRDGNLPESATSVQEARRTIEQLARASLIHADEESALLSCVETVRRVRRPSHAQQANGVRCLAIVDKAKTRVGLRVADLDRLRLLRDFAKDVQVHHQELRTFWLQAAQLVLLNLLLPILTALLGYIFGTQVVR